MAYVNVGDCVIEMKVRGMMIYGLRTKFGGSRTVMIKHGQTILMNDGGMPGRDEVYLQLLTPDRGCVLCCWELGLLGSTTL